MTSDRSAYATLGLRPGAGRAELNDAYRRLMKKHHPDRPGGDAGRAAEINSAYTLLRRRLGDPVRMPVRVYAPPPRCTRPKAFGRLAWLVMIAAVAGIAYAAQSEDARGIFLSPGGFASQLNGRGEVQVAMVSQPLPQPADFDEPVQRHIVDDAIANAIRLHSTGNFAAAGVYSSECYKSLSRERNLVWFDACTAFDEAMLTLNGDTDSGTTPFSESAVLTREIAAAQMLSPDSFGADSHLHQVRSQVDLKILPMMDSAAAARR
jgi:hypothetical protein